ncbi:tRNA pseudouridine(38-40) synthase TruA [Candidatus Saganbacteria bacterium CG08_land_8_20_14_0_20_45_16]|uniref:tRNA pseudouridine synthase A n=1 Tax=Candidatus Saganbacteria bacterium CG08_land_8_20_14_0_20_45_16 TaxID=2014293 RepID=A0A2H0XZU5_UNCSA|nr:MAG: tRNA pseudouridine(38-40) synthase TruA [Candidatus Saganbacteria bacterium CG08_land_8_20_14_0_20_45_16]
MRNFKLIVQYDGAGFSGFELQPNKRTVRAELGKALFSLFNYKVKLINSSRTDAGVHAIHLVVNFEVETKIPTAKVLAALNSILPEDIRIVKIENRKSKIGNFHARYDAKSKEYEYLIYNGLVVPPHIRKIVWQVTPKLDLKKMKQGAKYLIGKHEFSSFCATGGDDKNFVRIIHSLDIGNWKLDIWHKGGVPVISIRVRGSGFLYKMVRNIVGTLVEVGLGKRQPNDVKAILNAKSRKKAGRCAPGEGLCLIDVAY